MSWHLMVAPLAGAWIEIMGLYSAVNASIVAPLAGAWIEIDSMLRVLLFTARRSPRGSVD